MKDNNEQNSWSEYDVAKNLGYLENFDIVSQEFKSFFQEINSLNNSKEIKILDIGCGNARKAFVLSNHFPEKNFYYFGIDVNKFCIEAANKHFNIVRPKNLRIEFSIKDLNEQEISFDNKFDYAICDSVINMVENPEKVLKEMNASAEIIFLSRVKQTLGGEILLKDYHVWNGMKKPSVNWSFGDVFFENFFKQSQKKLFINKDTHYMSIWAK